MSGTKSNQQFEIEPGASISGQHNSNRSGLPRFRYVLPDVHDGEHWIDIVDTSEPEMAVGDASGKAGFSLSPNDKTPLLQDRLMRSLSGMDRHAQYDSGSTGSVEVDNALKERVPAPIGASSPKERSPTQSNGNRTLGTFSGVFSPVALSIFSTLLFLRMGFVVGQAGILYTLLILLISYSVLALTILAICAISTNGAVEGGGAYFMISRTLGPEFGGSLGLLFFLANSFASALYIAGFVEAVTDNFGPTSSLPSAGYATLPTSQWWDYLYKTVVNIFNVVIILLGAGVFSKMTAGLFILVLLSYVMVVASFCAKDPQPVPISNPYITNVTANYTGFQLETFHGNLFSHFGKDYTNSDDEQNFLTVFGVLFASVTGIMAGANMSGELKNPNKAIPRGTVQATSFTLIAYTVLAFLIAFTCDNFLLRNDYNFLQAINLWSPFVIIGIFLTTLSAAMACLVGASRILEAVAKDDLFGILLRPASFTTASGNPVAAVLFSFLVVQVVLLMPKFNKLAPIVTVFYLLVYAFSNLACLTLELASAPNFRPTFHYYSWHTCLLGFVSSLVMAFLVKAVYAAGAVIILLLLVIFIWWYSPPAHAWGSISQALIFHQVRKYLLMLDSRREHVKYWRPQVLLLVNNPRSSCELIDFVNDIKKGGLYVLGNVQVGSLDDFLVDPTIAAYSNWLGLVDHLRVKAFVELSMASSVREGIQNLYRLSGLGGMKPNTVCLGFYDDGPQENSLEKALARGRKMKSFQMDSEQVDKAFPPTRSSDEPKTLALEEYMDILFDVLKSQKNLLITRNFNKFNKAALRDKKVVVDVWPTNFLQPETVRILDTTSLLMLQLACILEMVESWHKVGTLIRVFLCVNREDDAEVMKKNIKQVLTQLRIPAKVIVVNWDHITYLLTDSGGANGVEDSGHVASLEDGTINVIRVEKHGDIDPSRYAQVPDDYLQGINELVQENSRDTTVTFMYLPLPPSDSQQHHRYISQYEWITRDLPPTVLVHGVSSVTTTVL